MDFSLLDVQFQRASVPVLEFSAAFKDGERPEMVVRQLTADEKRSVLREATTRGEYLYYDQALLAFYGTVTGDVDESGMGKRAFKSADFLRNLPERYGPAVVRLANKVMELSGMLKPVSTETDPDEQTALEQEKKG